MGFNSGFKGLISITRGVSLNSSIMCNMDEIRAQDPSSTHRCECGFLGCYEGNPLTNTVRWWWLIAWFEQLINECKVLVIKPESKYFLEDLSVDERVILKVDPKEMVWDGVNLIRLIVDTTMNVRIPTRLEITWIAEWVPVFPGQLYWWSWLHILNLHRCVFLI